MTCAVLLTRSGSTEDTDVVFPLLLSSYSSYREIQPDEMLDLGNDRCGGSVREMETSL